MKIDTDIPPPNHKSGNKKRDWTQVPIGGSFEFDEKPQAIVSSFGNHLAAGKYSIKRLPNGKHRFWRIG